VSAKLTKNALLQTAILKEILRKKKIIILVKVVTNTKHVCNYF